MKKLLVASVALLGSVAAHAALPTEAAAAFTQISGNVTEQSDGSNEKFFHGNSPKSE